ncbi:MAG: lamin tail domain-containing protein [Bacteroidales bacterium]|nr:lamin tail domain-containing protein [Bacteroidales bacterium]
MKKIMFVALALLMGLASCVKDKQYPGINIANVSYAPTAVQATDDVTVTATITSFKDFTAKLVYSTDEANKAEELGMVAGENNLYTAVIPAQPDGTKVSFYVQAMNGEVTAVSPAMEYEVGAVAIDYSKLRLNELNGNDKFIEIYNAGAEAINLNGVYIEKDDAQNWIGDNTVKIDAGAYLVLYSEDVVADHPEVPESLIFHSGLSAKKNVRIQLFTPAGVSIDDFNLTNIDANDPAYIPAPASYSRNADGKWYYADATPGAANVDGTVALLGLEGGDTPEPPTPEEPDYTNLVLNELNGDTKFIEIYNKGNVDLSLEGMYIMKDDYVAGATWTGDATIVAPAHGYVLLYSEDVTLDHPEVPETMIFHSGFSAKKSVRITLFMPDGAVRDEFTRENSAAPGEWGVSMSNVAPQSYARTPDGGDWKLADATPGEANPATGDDIPQE